MSQFDLGNLGGMMQMAQQRMGQFKENAKNIRAEGRAGGGLVRVVATGELQVVEVHISPKATEDPELLEDLIRAATNDALAAIRADLQRQIQSMTGGLPIPPGLMPF